MAEATQTKVTTKARFTLLAAVVGIVFIIIGIKTIDDSITRGLR